MRISSSPGRGVSREVDLSSLPTEYHDKAQRGGGCFLVAFSLLWGGLPTVFLIVSILRGTFEPGMLFVLIFTTIGAIMFIAGLKMASTRRVIRFAPDRISLDERSIFGHQAWSEPLSAFAGIASRSEHHSGGRNHPSYTLYIIELHHPEKRKRIRLYESRVERGLRKRLESYCRALNLPAMEGEGEHAVVRAVEDLDKSVRELAREGKLEVEFDPSRPPPTGFHLHLEGDRLRIELPPARPQPVGLLIALILPGIFIWVGFAVPGAPGFLGIMGILFLLILCLIAGVHVLARPILIVDPTSVHVAHRLPWGETKGRTIAAGHIETVRVGRAVENQGRPGVLLVTDARTETIGSGLDPQALAWLRTCILAVIAR